MAAITEYGYLPNGSPSIVSVFTNLFQHWI